MDSKSAAVSYDAYYYAHSCGRPYQRDEEWLRFFGGIADRIIRDIQPHTVLDAGCALGFLVEAFRTRGIEAFGIDLSEYAIQNVHPSIQPYCRVGSVTEPFPQKYDLIVCIEVLEHLSPRETERAVEIFCQASGDILFSSTPVDYREATHLNVQPPEYWAELFARQNSVRDVDFDATFITPWAVRFRRSGEPLPRLVRGYERKLWLLNHEKSEVRSVVVEMRDQLAAKDQEIQSLNARIAEIENNENWRLVRKLQSGQDRFAPQNSFRKRLLDKLVQTLLERG